MLDQIKIISNLFKYLSQFIKLEFSINFNTYLHNFVNLI